MIKHITFKTRDGSIIMDRNLHPLVHNDDAFIIKDIMPRNAKEKGVRVVTYNVVDAKLLAIVDWL